MAEKQFMSLTDYCKYQETEMKKRALDFYTEMKRRRTVRNFSENGEKKKHYYVSESVGIATGILIAGLHHAGLALLTYTPANMRFLNKILARPKKRKTVHDSCGWVSFRKCACACNTEKITGRYC